MHKGIMSSEAYAEPASQPRQVVVNLWECTPGARRQIQLEVIDGSGGAVIRVRDASTDKVVRLIPADATVFPCSRVALS